EAQIQVQIASEQKNIELAQKQAEKTKESLRVSVVEPANADKEKQMAIADAEKYRQIAEAQARAEAKKVEAQAEADAITLKAQANADAIAKTGIAEAEATKAKGLAEAEAMEKKAEAYEKYGQAAMMEMLVKVLPQMAEQVAKPLQSIDKVTIIDSGEGSTGSGVGQMGGYVPSVLAKTIESIKETTGFDVTDVMKASTIQAKTDRNVKVEGMEGVSNLTINNGKEEQ
ncbi:MAG: flotillin domain-containing protein, partial [Lachnospira sp.]|nr:flotillin domain-containing protein [Lachnospira sp.]